MLPVMRIQLKSRLWRHLRRFIPHSGALGVNIHPPHTSPGLTLHPPPTLTHCHRYTTTHPSSQESSVCWKCHRELNDGGDGSHGVRFFCPCDKNVVLPPSTSHTYFEIMDCPATYRVDIETLKQTFKQLQRQLHPDKFSSTSQVEQEFSAQQSALVNRAYTTLLKPYTRGLYLLELNGLTIDEKDTLMDAPEFLERMWAVRESLDDATTSGDTAALEQLQTTNSENLEKVSNEVGKYFDSGDYAAAKESLARMKYFVNIDELLKETLDLPP